MNIKKRSPGATTPGQQNNTSYKANYILVLQHIKSKQQYLSRKFWVANYGLEESRQDHAARGHLWKQILYCLALLVFRMIGRVMP